MTIFEMFELLGNFGEFVGAVAVVATLVFVGIQVRQSTLVLAESNKFARTSALDEALRQFSQFRRLIAGDSDVARVWVEGRQGGELNDIDSERFHSLTREYHNIMRNSFIRQKSVGADTYSESIVESWASQIRQYPSLRRIVEGPDFDESGFNTLVFASLEMLEKKQSP